jgi:hypothetical protein
MGASPTRPVRLIAGFPPGGVVDVFARLIGQWLSERLGQPLVIENRPGAGGNLAAEAVVRAAPDGYTLLMVGANNAFNVMLYDNLSFDFVRDIAPVASIYRGPAVLEVHPSFPAKSVPELIAYAKANPGKVNMASAGVGTPQHVYGELFKMMTGVDMLHVPYRGGGPALTDLLAGQVPLMFDTLATSIEHIRAGTLGGVAGHPDRRRLRAGLLGNRLAGARCSQEYARRNHRQAQQGDQCGSRRSPDEGADRRFRLRGVCKLARRLRHVHRRIYREVGQGDQVLRRQGVLIPRRPAR